MCNIKKNLELITSRIDAAAKKFGKNTDHIKLLAVSKTKPISAISQAIAAGQLCFGENYVQEAVDKIKHFRPLNPQVEWHFIGPIQSNKTLQIAQNFDWVHSVDRIKIISRLSEQRPQNMPPLQVLIQINTSGESSKSGTNFEDAKILAKKIDKLSNLTLRGLMCIPQTENEIQKQMDAFAPLASFFKEMKANYPHFDTLSMGMSGDMESAIASGSTMVRIGSAIFGGRN